MGTSARQQIGRRARALLAMTAGAAALGAVVALVAAPHHAGRARARAGATAPQWDTGRWSAATLARCSAPLDPQVAFPQQTPFRRTGTGAVVFGASSRPCGLGKGGGEAPGALAAAPIASDDIPLPAHPILRPGPRDHLAGPPQAPLALAATTAGQLVAVAAQAAPAGPTGPLVLGEGSADGPPSIATTLPATPAQLATATAYLGDVAIATLTRAAAETVQLSMQRHFARRLAAPVSLGGARGPKRALAVALDYRTDALAVWWQRGWLYARERHANGPLGPLQRFARAGPQVQLSVLISDDGHAILAWMNPYGHTDDLYLDISEPGMELASGRLIERLHRHAGAPAARAVSLVRLSTESVLMAWTGTRGGHSSVRAAGIDLKGLRTVATVSRPREAALLQSLATGPGGDAVATWTTADGAGAGHGRSTIMAARAVPSSRGVPHFGRPEHIAVARAPGHVALAIDPTSDRAVACWRESAGPIRCAVRHALGSHPARGG